MLYIKSQIIETYKIFHAILDHYVSRERAKMDRFKHLWMVESFELNVNSGIRVLLV